MQQIIKKLKHVEFDGELSRIEFLDICYWKSPPGSAIATLPASSQTKAIESSPQELRVPD
jgi:hypothetical protein